MQNLISTRIFIQGVEWNKVDLHTLPTPGELVKLRDTYYTVESRDFLLSVGYADAKNTVYRQSAVLYLK